MAINAELTTEKVLSIFVTHLATGNISHATIKVSHPSYACHIGKTLALQPTTHPSLTANSQRNQKGLSSHLPTESRTSHHTPDPAGYQTLAIRKATVLHQHHDMGSMLSCLLRLSEGQRIHCPNTGSI